jgi:DNA-binding XRE family transcriptional regulator
MPAGDRGGGESLRLGEVIRKWRLMSEVDLRKLAGDIGINHSTLYRIEKGEACDSRTLAKVIVWLLSEAKAHA